MKVITSFLLFVWSLALWGGEFINPCQAVSTFCTKEYIPHECTHAKLAQPARGGNRCEAYNHLLTALCELKITKVDTTKEIHCAPTLPGPR